MASAPLSFKPWSLQPSKETSLQDVLARVGNERGAFRDISEASLRDEIANGVSTPSSSSESSDDEDDDDPTSKPSRPKASTRQELFAVRAEMLGEVQSAQNEILLALDFVSLLESSHAPQQAGVTVSQALKAVAPLGTLGTDIWHRMPQNRAREGQDNLLATKVRMQTLQKSADDLLAAAGRLEDNVRRETVFWDQVLAISERGWSVSRIPRTQGVLGVHFGFNGSAGEFARRDLAALLPGEDGGIALERGVGTKPKGIKVVLKRDGRVVGSSRLPAMPDEEETTLEARIRHARDSLYDEELFHEMVREARTLTSMGVEMRSSTLSFVPASNASLRIELELVLLEDAKQLEDTTLHHLDDLAQATLLAARLLLGQAHREKIKQKTEPPPPMSDRKDETPILAIIRPILLVFTHHTFCQRLNTYATNIETLLGNADINATVKSANFTFSLPDDLSSTTSESIINAIFLRPLTATASIAIPTPSDETEDFRLDLSIETSSAISLGSAFSIRLPSASAAAAVGTPQAFTLSAIEDLFSTADEMLATQMLEVLYPHADPAKAWTLIPREGKLGRNVGDEEDGDQEEVSLAIDGEVGNMNLVFVASDGRDTRKGDWKVDKEDSRDDVSLWQVWKDVVGVDGGEGEDEEEQEVEM
ncbi:RNA polymerase II mediator complex component SRB4 like protein [Zymoseptoria brevis]|uniref:Mediator of RNA polymerase II transcription subunit 17 n=1 Tax=Zymoseptoria brevis TaxID=1047168 RepID=A0A0F4G7W6_9PEZI|nr:RNA polymerase II mediator complex component SRB4 like protein [Zymoseptoria brevis]